MLGPRSNSFMDAAPPRRRGALLARLALVCILALASAPAAAEPIRIVAFGDSLISGFGLPLAQAFPARLEAALQAKGLDVRIENAGVSGDTAAAGLARVEWAVPPGTQAVILCLGANDALRGLAPELTAGALDGILLRLKARRIEVLLAGMYAPPNLGTAYALSFDAIYPDLARRHEVAFYPFFLQDVAGQAKLNLSDGMHPNAAGIDAIVARMLPEVEALIARVQARKGG